MGIHIMEGQKIHLFKNYLQIYHEGLKRCSKCDIFFKTERYFCSCCGTAMRSKPRVSRKKVEHIRM